MTCEVGPNAYATYGCCSATRGGAGSAPLRGSEGWEGATTLHDELCNHEESWTALQRRFMRLFAEFQLTFLTAATALSMAVREARYKELMDAADAVRAEGDRTERARMTEAGTGIGQSVLSAGLGFASARQSLKQGTSQREADFHYTKMHTAIKRGNDFQSVKTSADTSQASANLHGAWSKRLDVAEIGSRLFTDGCAKVSAAELDRVAAYQRAEQSESNANAQMFESSQTLADQQAQQALQKGEDGVQQKRENAKREEDARSRCLNLV